MAQFDTSIPNKHFEVRRLEARDVVAYRELRLEGLQRHPEAFGASFEDEVDKPDAWWTERLESNVVFGGWIDNSPLLGVAGFRAPAGVKHRHRGELWGMYVRPDGRGTGLAASLAQRVIEHARPLVEEIGLTVVASNTSAHRLYSAAGFEPYGLARRALKVGNDYYDEVLMALSLRRP